MYTVFSNICIINKIRSLIFFLFYKFNTTPIFFFLIFILAKNNNWTRVLIHVSNWTRVLKTRVQLDTCSNTRVQLDTCNWTRVLKTRVHSLRLYTLTRVTGDTCQI
jgi:hypothetical protein